MAENILPTAPSSGPVSAAVNTLFSPPSAASPTPHLPLPPSAKNTDTPIKSVLPTSPVASSSQPSSPSSAAAPSFPAAPAPAPAPVKPPSSFGSQGINPAAFAPSLDAKTVGKFSMSESSSLQVNAQNVKGASGPASALAAGAGLSAKINGVTPSQTPPIPPKPAAKATKKKNPLRSVLLFLFLGVSIIFSLFYVIFQTQLLSSQADNPNIMPNKQKVTNITGDSFTLTFVTADPVVTAVRYASSVEDLKNKYIETYDERNEGLSAADRKPYSSHQITLKGLNPQTTYYFQIIVEQPSGWGQNKIVYTANDDAPYTQKTYARNTSNNNATVYGTLTKGTTPLPEALVYIEVNDASSYLGGMSVANGNWRVPLNFIYDDQSSAPMMLQEDNTLLISIVEASTGLAHEFQTTYKVAKQGLNIDVSRGQEQFGQEASPSADVQASHIVDLDLDTLQTVDTATPTFIGTAQPNQSISLSINDNTKGTLRRQTVADKNGKFAYNLATAPAADAIDLSPGAHTVTSSLNSKITNFIVDLGEELVATEPSGLTPASPEPTPAPTPTPTPEPAVGEELKTGSLSQTAIMLIAGVFFLSLSMGSYLLWAKNED